MTIFFKVQTFTLTGDTRYSEEHIVAATGLQPGDNLVLFDKFSIIDQIFDACPYLDTVQIRRRYPDRVEIIVTECVAIAVIEDEKAQVPDPEDETKTIQVGGTGRWLIDRNGKLLEKTSSSTPTKLTRVYGVTLKEPQIGKYVEILQEDIEKPLFLLLNTAEDDGILQDIGGMDFSKQYDIRFNYLERFTVEIGSTEDLDKKLRYLHTIIQDKLGTNARGTLDLSDVQTARFIPTTD
jgi:cell division protein FtsQ